MNWKAGIIVVVIGSVGGCFTPEPKSLNASGAPSKIPAIKAAAEAKDQKAVPRLIADLDDNDSAIRFAAIYALERITGDTLGYRYYDDQDARKPALGRWQQWLKEHPIQ